MKRSFFLFLYYFFAIYLPVSQSRAGKVVHSKKIRYIICRHIFKHCGKNVNIEKGARFGNGSELEIGDNSGIGVNCVVPFDIKIGADIMMGPNCFILSENHDFSRIDIPMRQQGYTKRCKTIIEDDVWIGRDVLMTPGRIVKRGSVIGAGTVLCKNFPEFSIVGGNPSRLIRSRIELRNE